MIYMHLANAILDSISLCGVAPPEGTWDEPVGQTCGTNLRNEAAGTTLP
jgi:hypothetical protein